MRSLNIGLYKSQDTPYPEFISEYIFDIDSVNKESLETYGSELSTQAFMFATELKSKMLGALRLNIYVPEKSEIMLVTILRAIYCTAYLEVNIYHYIKPEYGFSDNDSNRWVSQNFQLVPEIDRDKMIVRPHSMNEAYYS